MNRSPSRHLLLIAGSVALALALVWSAIGLVLYGQDMTPNLLAELAGVSVEVAVAALIVDRLMSRHQRQQWDFAYRALAKQASEAFVDVMRLVDVRGSVAALQANLSRYEFFVQLGEQHLGDLRSHIESSATALDPHTHEQYRRVERRLSWCLGQLRTTPAYAESHQDLFVLLRETATLLFQLLSKDGDGHRAELAAAQSSVAQARPTSDEHRDRDDGLDGRLRAQTLLLTEIRGERRPISSISQDVDSDFFDPLLHD